MQNQRGGTRLASQCLEDGGKGIGSSMSRPHGKFEASLGFIRPCLKKKENIFFLTRGLEGMRNEKQNSRQK